MPIPGGATTDPMPQSPPPIPTDLPIPQPE